MFESSFEHTFFAINLLSYINVKLALDVTWPFFLTIFYL